MAGQPDDETGERGERTVLFTRNAARGFRRMPRDTEDLIRHKLRQLAADPTSLANDVKALKGGQMRYRLRVGDHWAIFTVEPDRVIVHDVGPRSSIYD